MPVNQCLTKVAPKSISSCCVSWRVDVWYRVVAPDRASPAADTKLGRDCREHDCRTSMYDLFAADLVLCTGGQEGLPQLPHGLGNAAMGARDRRQRRRAS
jgi:hypothetical protein